MSFGKRNAAGAAPRSVIAPPLPAAVRRGSYVLAGIVLSVVALVAVGIAAEPKLARLDWWLGGARSVSLTTLFGLPAIAIVSFCMHLRDSKTKRRDGRGKKGDRDGVDWPDWCTDYTADTAGGSDGGECGDGGGDGGGGGD